MLICVNIERKTKESKVIEKLKRPVKIGGTTFREKINELIDAANEYEKDREEIKAWIAIVSDLRSRVPVVESRVAILEEHAHPTAETPADPYAEQRKWIGKLCKFWDDEDEGYVYEILIDIEDDGSDYPYKMTDEDSENWTMSYKHCEPVSEDLIYKGE